MKPLAPLGRMGIRGEFLLLALLESRMGESSLLFLGALFLKEADLSFCMVLEGLGLGFLGCERAAEASGSSLSELVVEEVLRSDEDMAEVFKERDDEDFEELLEVVFCKYFLFLAAFVVSSGFSTEGTVFFE